ncbi:MAG: phosphatase domain-containing protein, partial [Anaerolineaceae bacterium]|nr:phosphatase domain-containing protein [Anaerolineaceae bacterium]
MSNWQQVLAHYAHNVEQHFDELKYKLHYRLGGPDPIKIVPYRGFGKQGRLYLKGRVLEDKGDTSSLDNDNIWDNLVDTYKRMESDEVPYARLLVRFDGQEQEVVADEEGYFEAWVTPPRPLPADRLWHNVELKLLEPLSPRQKGPVLATGEVFVPPADARFAVVSDIDDTVLQTDATNLLRMARNVFLSNARTRLPFPGVAALYRALHAGPQGDGANPMFYVSSSPWNLYDLLGEFFHLQDIPNGPVLFLRDWGLTENEFLPTSHHDYKIGVIRRLMDFYPELPFILLGDSGQEDPEIYHEIVTQYPDRVAAIYIRNVSRNLKRPEAIRALAEKVVQARSVLILADNTEVMARHAAEQGWIAPAMIPGVQVEKEKDQAPPNLVEQLTGQTQAEEAPAVVVRAEEESGAAAGQEGPLVTVSGPDEEAVHQKVRDGAVEAAIQDAGRQETSRPPAVIVQGTR